MRPALLLAAIISVAAPVVVSAQEPVDCGPKGDKHEVIKHKGERPLPRPAAGRSMIVIVVGGSFYKSYQQKLAVNGEWRAVMNESQYSFFEVDPGLQKLCWAVRSGKRDDNFLLLTTRPDETYYIRGTVAKGISELDADEAQKLVQKMTYVTFEARREN
ncbi:MAG TPA: hypothetical protein VN654_15905 [Vicinamibacterales bacterium]|jgi:hypothetical protein|nr:hypothetical protein [Vicinamibacterales bacterium]